MKIHAATRRDNEANVMRLELSGEDVETLEFLVDRLDILLDIEKAMGVVSVQSPFILGKDVPTVTAEGTDLIRQIVKGWEK